MGIYEHFISDWGKVRFTVDEYLKKHNISRNAFARNAHLTYQQVLNLCRNEALEINLGVLARICYALNCKPEDIFEYHPPKEK